MNTQVRILSCAALIGAALAGLGQFRPAWAAQMNLDWWSLPELHEQLRRDEERAAAQQRTCAGLHATAVAKRQVTEELLAGRITLPRAAARFRDINAAPGAAGRPLEGNVPGATEEERLCRQVISWAAAQAELPRQPGSGLPTRDRLEAELNALLQRNHGTVPLPE